MGLGLYNDNKVMVDRFLFEQCAFSPVTGVAGTNIENDGKRYIYAYFQTSTTAAQFWRYCTWGDGWQQLATPPTQTGTVSNMVYTRQMGSQVNGQVHGAVYLFTGNGATCYWYKYDIGTNTWSANLGTTGIPANFATDVYVNFPSPHKNNYEYVYHTGVTKTVSLSASAAAGATTLSVATLPEAMKAGTCLRFQSYNMTITSAASKGGVTLSVSGNVEAMKAGSIFTTNDGREFCLSADSLAGAATLSVRPLPRDIQISSVVVIEKMAVLTADAAQGVTSLTVSPLRVGIPNASVAPYYGNMYMIGNNSTVMYRYNIGANAWYTTSANSGNPAIPAIAGAIGAGCALKWLPAYEPNKLFIIRGSGTANIYTYDLVNNVFATLTYYPATETFTTGTMVAARDVGGKQANLIMHKDATNRYYEFIPYKNTLEPKLMQQQYPAGGAVVGDKTGVMTSPDGVEYLYIILHSSNAVVRCPLIDS